MNLKIRKSRRYWHVVIVLIIIIRFTDEVVHLLADILRMLSDFGML